MGGHSSKLPGRKKILEHFDERDPVMAGIIRQTGPFQLKRNQNYFVVLCKAILAQQISTAAAHAITVRFHALFDNHSPTPERVLKLSDQILREVGLSRQKTAYLKDLSRHFQGRTIRPHRLHYLDNEEVVEQLTAVHGIGRWTAEMFLIFSLNRLDVLPIGDLGLQLALKKIYGMRKLPTPRRMHALGKKWHPMETVATWYAWRTQDEEIIAY